MAGLNYKRKSPDVLRFLQMVLDHEGPITGREMAALLYPKKMPWSAPSRAGQILAALTRHGWLERIDMGFGYRGPDKYVLNEEGRKVLAEKDSERA